MKTLTAFLLFSFFVFGNLQAQNAVNLTLKNTGMKSIPLIIPGVMNPNLSPFSNSGVSLAVGQKIYFPYRGKQVELYEVAAKDEGKVIKVGSLIKKRKKGLRKIQD